MDAMEAILTRRSVRKYSKKKISKKIILKLLEAGVSAPSAGDEQPWQFVIIDKRNILDKIMEFHPYSNMLKEAQKAILVCGDLDLETHKGYWMIDCSAATQNILIASRAIGLGACWLGIYPREERIIAIKEILKIPENIIPFALISLGYPGEEQTTVDRLDDFRIHKNQW
jgi:nitroreductase